MAPSRLQDNLSHRQPQDEDHLPLAAAVARSASPIAGAGAGLAANLDVVREILLRLPVKSIVRFKCVCSDWRDLTSDPHFVASHTRRNPSVSGVFLYNGWSTLYNSSCSTADGSRIFPEPWVADDGETRVYCGIALHSCNGLLVGKYLPGDLEEDNRKVVLVYNPATLQHRILPEFPWYRHRRAVLAFDPRRSADYGVLVLCNYPDEIKLYSSETNSWQTLFSMGKDPWISSLHLYHYCFCNGLVYWFTVDRFLIVIDVEKRSVVGKMTTRICLPENYDVGYCGPSRGGRLRLTRYNFTAASIHFRPMDPSAVVEVLELQSDRSSWLLLHRVQIMELYSEICKLKWNVPVTSVRFFGSINTGIAFRSCLVEDEEHGDVKMVLTMEDKILAYDLGSRSLRVLRTTNNKCQYYEKLVPCTATLVAP